MPNYTKGNVRAVKAVVNYANNPRSKTEACKQAGYSDMTASKCGTAIIERGTKELAKQTGKEAQTILEKLGKTRKDLVDRVNYIALEQNKDLSTASRILAPLLKAELGLDITGKDEDQKTPVLNITLNNPQLNQAPERKVYDIGSDNVDCAT